MNSATLKYNLPKRLISIFTRSLLTPYGATKDGNCKYYTNTLLLGVLRYPPF